MNAQRWQDWLSALIGLYVVLSPHIVPHFYPGPSVPGAAALSHYLAGAAICLIGIAALSNSRFWQEWANLVLGSWLVVSPWVLGFADLRPISWSAVLSGAVIVILSTSVLLASRRSIPMT